MRSQGIIIIVVVITFTSLLLAGLNSGYIQSKAVLQDGSTPLLGNLDMNHNYILNLDYEHWFHLSLEGGKTDETLILFLAGFETQNRYYYKIMIGSNKPVGIGKLLNVTLTNNIKILSVSLTGDAIFNWSITEAFVWNVATEDLKLHYFQSGGGGITSVFVIIQYHYKENA